MLTALPQPAACACPESDVRAACFAEQTNYLKI